MMSPQKAFSYYYGMHLHFTSEKYSILKYGVDTKQAISKFKVLPQGLKYKFQWLSDKFQVTQDVVYACIASELNELNIQFADKQAILDSYYLYKSRRESIGYVLTAEYNKYVEKNETKFHQLIFNYFAGIYSPEFVLLMDHDYNHLSKIVDDSAFSFARPKILKLIKYKNFFSTVKYNSIKYHEESVPA